MDTSLPIKNANEFANDLFETCNLSEIESLQNTLKKDVEKKADQLKSLVRFVLYILKINTFYFKIIHFCLVKSTET